MPQQILNNIKSFVNLNIADEEAFIKIMDIKQYKKKEFLMIDGSVCDKISFINSGCIRVFFLVDGVENTFQFLFDNGWYTDYESFLSGNPTSVNLQFLEDSVVVQFKKTDIIKLYETNPTFERLGRIMAELAYTNVTVLYRMIHNEEPEERYLKLLSERPDLIEKIPQHYIASYLGVKPQSLSRIRKRIFKKK